MKTKRIRVAKILSEAADYHLCNYKKQPVQEVINTYSCVAVLYSFKHSGISFDFKELSNLMKSLGLPDADLPGTCFKDKHGLQSERNQNERYMWLKFAAEYCRLHDVRVTIKSSV